MLAYLHAGQAIRMDPPSSCDQDGLTSLQKPSRWNWLVIVTALLWLAISFAAAAMIAATAKASGHWLGVFCLYSVIFMLIPLIPFLGWIERRRKRERLKNHTRVT